MAATIPNIAKGRFNELARRVKSGDPADSALVIVLFQAPVSSTLDQLRDMDTLEAIGAVETECDFTNYARIVLGADDIEAPTVDDVGNAQTLTISDQAIEAAGGDNDNDVGLVVIGYDPDDGSGDDSQIVPIFVDLLDTPVSTNGEAFHIRVHPSGLLRAGEPD